MSPATSILAKIGVFAGALVVGAVAASLVVSVMSDRSPVSSAGLAPEYLLASVDTPAGPGPVIGFNEEPAPPAAPGATPAALPTPTPVDLNAAAAALLGGTGTATTASVRNPSGFPRIQPITQFDGGPFAGSNCTLASGSMLARLGYGIVTTGSTLRTLQDDQDGGTDLNDLSQALFRGYGVSFDHGLVKPDALKKLLASGYGAVIQGIYGEIPQQLRLQKSFTGGHAIFVDGWYPGNPKKGIPEAYYVIDPLGRPQSGYEGDWWPASVVDKFALAFGGSRVAAMWGFPPGGQVPDVIPTDVLPIPPNGGGGSSAGKTPEPGATPTPTPDPSASVEPATPVGPVLADPGDLSVEMVPPDEPPVDSVFDDIVIAVPIFDLCLFSPKPAGCPTGVEAVFDLGDSPVLQLPAGPDVNIVFVDSDRPNVALVAFTVDPPATADVKFWVQGASPASVGHATSMTSTDIFGTTVLVAELQTLADTTYHFQAVAGNGLITGTSPIGSFTTGSGVAAFDVALAEAASPVFKFGTGLSPYIHVPVDGLARPLLKLDAPEMAGTRCADTADFGGTGYCLDVDALPEPATCTKASVSWTLAGLPADSVLVRAFPVEEGVTPDGDVVLDGVLEAEGAAPEGSASIGCLASGLTYHIVIDAVGDDRGILASENVTVP